MSAILDVLGQIDPDGPPTLPWAVLSEPFEGFVRAIHDRSVLRDERVVEEE